MDKAQQARLIKQHAAMLGFDFCGISKADFLEEEAPLLERWLQSGMHGSMQYMENHFDKRLNPRLLMPGAKSVISLLLNYYPSQKQNANSVYKISKYAYGRDYHNVIKKKLKQLVGILKTEIGDINYKMCVDSAPVMDKAWAKKSGLGWIGKHTNLINRQSGSFYFIAELIVDIELEYDGPVKDYCGTCTKCIDACPTDAITDPYVVDGSKCISYFTIELKDNIPDSYKNTFNDWVFGCDICQDVCPWNSFAQTHNEGQFKPLPGLLEMEKEEWEKITEQTFDKVFSGSPVKRTKYSGLKRNIKFVKQA